LSYPRRLNLGSGNEPLAGYWNLDRRCVPGVQIVGDVRALPLRSAHATHVLASSLLEHFEDPYAVLDEVHRVLAPDGTFVMRVPALWSYAAMLDRSHVFLADSKLWRQILSGYFGHVAAYAEGVRYRDSRILAAFCHVATRALGWLEFAEAWRFQCSHKRAQPTRAYIPWWLEGRYAADGRPQPTSVSTSAADSSSSSAAIGVGASARIDA
jgi:SAM-dependent methyltransferase